MAAMAEATSRRKQLDSCAAATAPIAAAKRDLVAPGFGALQTIPIAAVVVTDSPQDSLCAGPPGRLRPLGNASLEILEIAVHLLKRKAKREEALRCVAGKTTRQSFAPHCGDFGVIGIERRFDGFQR
jgi:hypothetical protein